MQNKKLFFEVFWVLLKFDKKGQQKEVLLTEISQIFFLAKNKEIFQKKRQKKVLDS